MKREIGPPPPYDPELVEGLELIAEVIEDFKKIKDLPSRRSATEAVMQSTLNLLEPSGGFEFEERSIPSLQTGAPDIPLLVCRPTESSAPTPVVYFIHGGGMWAGNARLGLETTLEWARELQLTVVSVEYRLAPECPYPGPVEDCYAGLVWIVENATELGIDPARVIVNGGSAGGGLSAATVLLARDRGGPALIGQILNCPMLDDRNDSVSSVQFTGRGGTWDREANQEGWTALLGEEVGTDSVSLYAAPARAGDLSGLPPTFIDVGSAETFRDEAVDYASRIWATGGQAELHVWAGGFHGFAGLVPDAAVSVAAREGTSNWVRRLVANGALADTPSHGRSEQ